ncbi:hypothetical protein Goari_006652 [Gossypium aridum]|uniref:Uncharacterized protein n=1 Tax=Gossypium aridum TaxID=34290 RepID=A0A7J8XP95_GOSAI|nr:hypothetical protein [Gossypium aridum]
MYHYSRGRAFTVGVTGGCVGSHRVCSLCCLGKLMW